MYELNHNLKRNFLLKQTKEKKRFINIVNILNTIFSKKKKYILYIIFIIFSLFLVYRITTFLGTTVLDFFFLKGYHDILINNRKERFQSNVVNILFFVTKHDLLHNPKSNILLNKIISIDLENKRIVSASISPYFAINPKDNFISNSSIYNYFQNKHNLNYKDILNLNSFLSDNYLFNRYNYYFYISLSNYLNVLNHLNIKCDLVNMYKDHEKLDLEFSDDDIKSLDFCMNNLLNQLSDISFLFKFLLNFPKNIFSFGTYTNFTLWELLEIFFVFPTLRGPMKYRYFSVTEYATISSNDSLNLYYPDIIKIKQDIHELFFKLDIIKEQARIEIFNSTSVSGLASRIKNIIDIYGGKVITFNNFPENFEETLMFINNTNSYSYKSTLKLVNFIFGKKIKTVNNNQSYNFSGDIAIIIGSDYINDYMNI